MSDPRTFEDDTQSYDECDVCEAVNPTTYWESSLTRRWSREAFTCVCGEHHREIDSRGGSEVLFILMVMGAALIVLGLINLAGGHFDWWPLLLGGFWLVAAPLAIALFIGANRQKEADHE